MKEIKNLIQCAFNGGQYVMMALQGDQVLKYIELGLSILTTLIILGFNIWSWYKRASADGKITEDEIKEGKDIIKKGAKDIQDNVNKNKGE